MSSMNIKKASTIASALSLVAFLAFAGFTVASINNISSVVEDTIIANKSGVPSGWNSLETTSAVASETVAEIKGDYIKYTTSLTNSSDELLTVSQVSSYLADGKSSGFVPLSANTFEYTYTPEDANSWVSVSLSGQTTGSAELSKGLTLGPANSESSTIYFRYNIAPTEEGLVDDKISFVTETASGSAAVTSSTTSVDFGAKIEEPEKSEAETPADTSTTEEIGAETLATETTETTTETSTEATEFSAGQTAETSTETVAEGTTIAEAEQTAEQVTEESTDPESVSGEEEYTEPLGVISESTAAIISAATLGTINVSQDSIGASITVIIVALAVFAACLVTYLIIRSHADKKQAIETPPRF